MTKSYRAKHGKTLNVVKTGTRFAKWGDPDKFLLNGVIIVRIENLGGKNWNLLLIIYMSDTPSVPVPKAYTYT
jgi:hypothetical protein